MGSVFVLDSGSKQGLVSIRSLGRNGLHVTAGGSTNWTPGRLSKHTDRYVTYPWPEDRPELFARTIERELERGEYDMLLPTTEATVETIVRRKSRFEEHTTVPFPSYERLLIGLDKRRTIEAARRFDVPHPKTVFPDEHSTERIGDVLGYPVVVKPLRGSGRAGVAVCDSRDELERASRRIRKKHGPALFQEFIPLGGERGVYTLYDWSGELVGVTVQQRLRSNPPEGGASTLRETVEDPELVELTDGFLSSLGWRGLAMAEFRIDSRTGEPKLMEINPRFWGSLALSVYAGVDFPYLLYRLSIGEAVEPNLEYEVGVRARSLFTDLLQVFAREDRACALAESLAPSSKPCHYDVVSLTDPLPAVGQVGYGVVVLSDRLTRRSGVDPPVRVEADR